MQYRSGKELRELFIDFWVSKGSRHYPSFSLVPDDPSLLFTIAGMVPFKKYYLGMQTPETPRAVTSQKCIRTNDIENVGRTARHHTFFEMLGNFAWGDYFKKEAITWAYEFLTEYVGLEKDRLYATIYLDDEEAFDAWHNNVGLPEDRIYRFGEGENYWFMGDTGPCGPCSEIMYDQGPSFSCGKSTCDVGCDCDRYLEVWNLVFTQFDRLEDGSLLNLPKKNIDTGMGLERLTALVQGVNNDFATDLFQPLIQHTCKLAGTETGKDPSTDMAVKVISDHMRAIAFMIADGILPSNEGQGYVLRRLLRRASRFGRLIGLDRPFLCSLMPVLIEIMGDPYEELIEQRLTIEHVIAMEEEKFDRTLEQGTSLLENEISKLEGKKENILSGKVAFDLYDTYGFPLELTEEICQEREVEVNRAEFDDEMKKQRERARASSKQSMSSMKADVFSKILLELGPTRFVGYEACKVNSEAGALLKNGNRVDSLHKGDAGEVVLHISPFYGERGGQVGDTGWLSGENFEAEVTDTYFAGGDLIVNSIVVNRGTLKEGASVEAAVDTERRRSIMRNHTATHLLHEALQQVLGRHARQSGSMVSHEFLRFDFTHFEGLSPEQIREIEEKVNEKILENVDLNTRETTMEEAKKTGAKALFEEKYGDSVRVVTISDFSCELCGGLHVDSTGEIGLLKIIREESVGSGIRRITAVTGLKALSLVQSLFSVVSEISHELSAEPEELPARISELTDQVKALSKEKADLKLKLMASTFEDKLERRELPGEISLLTARFEDVPVDLLRELGDRVRNRNSGNVLLLASVMEGSSVQMTAMADEKALQAGIHCGKLVKVVSAVVSGGGGGRPAMAQAGGKDVSNLDTALEKAADIAREQISKE
jgi:alanyl-tRNA synthetase